MQYIVQVLKSVLHELKPSFKFFKLQFSGPPSDYANHKFITVMVRGLGLGLVHRGLYFDFTRSSNRAQGFIQARVQFLCSILEMVDSEKPQYSYEIEVLRRKLRAL